MGATATEPKKGSATEDKAEPRQKTNYVVLQVTGDTVTQIGEGLGLNDVQAIGEVAGALGIEEGDFVAVPARSWRIRSVSVQTKRQVSIK